MIPRRAVAAEPRLHGIGADHSEGRHGARERQDIALILEQYDRFALGIERERAVLRVAVPVGGAIGVHVGMLEQPQLELGTEHARDGRVDDRHRDEAALERLEIGPMLFVG